MGEFFHHPLPMALDHSLLREYAYTGNTEALRAYGNEIKENEPHRSYVSETLEIVIALAQSQYTTADALIDATQHKYEQSELKDFILQVTGLYEIFLHFSYGRFDQVRSKSAEILAMQPEKTGLQPIDRLVLLKHLADTAFLLDDYPEVERIAAEAEGLKHSGDLNQSLYFLNSIRCLNNFHKGDFRDTLILAERTIELANGSGYKGIAHDLAARNIQLRCYVAMADHTQAAHAADRLLQLSQDLNNWPWYFVTQGFWIKYLAQQNKMKEALQLVRVERERIAAFTFKNDLVLFPDAAELYVRYLLQDDERIQVLIDRLPELLLVRQIKSERKISHATLGLKEIQQLSEKYPREKLYKAVAFCEFYKDHESQALKYAREALTLTEKTGYVQFLLLQNQLYSHLLKACAIKPTAFTEEFARRLTMQIKSYEEQQKGDLVVPLTSRELEVVQHLATGKPISQIAATLHVSMNTMKTHLRNTYRKLDVDGRDGAVTKAKELFLI